MIIFTSIGAISASEDTGETSLSTNDEKSLTTSETSLSTNSYTGLTNSDSGLSANSYTSLTNSESEISNKEYVPITVEANTSIQSAINSASAGDTISVNDGRYNEDIIVNKSLTIIANGENVILNSNLIGFNIEGDSNNSKIIGFNINILNPEGIGIKINSNNCEIKNNIINNGLIGIEANKTTNNMIVNNKIYKQSKSGIIVGGSNLTITNNLVYNIKTNEENLTIKGIDIQSNTIGSGEISIKVKGNKVSNLVSTKGSAIGISLNGNAITDNIGQIDFTDNIIENIYCKNQSTGGDINIFSFNGTVDPINIENNTITNINVEDGNHTSASALRISLTTLSGDNTSSVKDLTINNNYIDGINGKGNGTSVSGIDITSTSSNTIRIINNQITNLNGEGNGTGISGTGVDYTKFNSLVIINNNTIFNIKSSKSKGINLVSLGNGTVRDNILYNIPGNQSQFINTIALNMENLNLSIPENATIKEILEELKKLYEKLNNSEIKNSGHIDIIGNNIEGSGEEEGIVSLVVSDINYNRIVNLKTNILKPSSKEYILDNYGFDPDTNLSDLIYEYLKNDKQYENLTEEELRNLSNTLGKFLESIFEGIDKLINGDINAKYNWWGANSNVDSSKFTSKNGNILYDPWLVLNINGNPNKITVGETSKIIVDVYTDSNKQDHSGNYDLFFSGPSITLSTTLGHLSSNHLNWTKGMASAIFYGDESGIAYITAVDYDNSTTSIQIVDNEAIKVESNTSIVDNEFNTVYSGNTIKMLNTGNPISILIIAVLLIIGSTVLRKRK